MISELLMEQCALFASGALTSGEREQFELIVRFHPEVRAFLADIEETALNVLGFAENARRRPSPALRGRIMRALGEQPAESHAPSFVLCEADGMVQWVNPAFSVMCGYTLEELRGKSLGPILQGEKTDAATAERMRRAVRSHHACQETILNYHKNGNPYWVEIAITPIVDCTGKAMWMVATEQESTERSSA